MNPEIDNILQEISDITEVLSKEDRYKLGLKLAELSAAILATTDYEKEILHKGQIDESIY